VELDSEDDTTPHPSDDDEYSPSVASDEEFSEADDESVCLDLEDDYEDGPTAPQGSELGDEGGDEGDIRLK
jgi:hypothetical protein